MAVIGPPPDLAWRVEEYLGPGWWSRWLYLANVAWREVPHAQPTSWFRTVAGNAAAGGHPRSQHLWGGALDFVIPGAGGSHETNPDARRLADAFARRGFTPVLEPDHLHVQTFPAR